MKATGLCTIQQTLTPEAAAVLSASIVEAARRGHGQTTPLHVAAALLAPPAGQLRRACLRSHPASSHPLQCRALELCFSVALERLPAGAAAAAAEPPISHALMAALKRAQAQQRRGCPESQQAPLLAVKVELEQLIVSILDDPGVSRVMREASFSSPVVKASIESSISSSSSPPSGASSSPINPFINPRLTQKRPSPAAARPDDVMRVMSVLSRTKKRNPVIVGDAENVVREVLRMIEMPEPVGVDARVVSLEKELVKGAGDRLQISARIKEMGELIEAAAGDRGVVAHLGDLGWLVDGGAAVAEVAEILRRLAGRRRVWLVGSATCETYLRCQVYYPSMEDDWDLQVIPIAAGSQAPSLFPRMGGSDILICSKGFPAAAAAEGHRRRLAVKAEESPGTTMCPSCIHGYEQELPKLVSDICESSSNQDSGRTPLPHWLRIATVGAAKPVSDDEGKERELILKRRMEELLSKWRHNCALLHSEMSLGSMRSPAPATAVPSSYRRLGLHCLPHLPAKLVPSKCVPRLQSSGHAPLSSSPDLRLSPPCSPAKSDLALDTPNPSVSVGEKATCYGDQMKDFSDEFSKIPLSEKIGGRSFDKWLFAGILNKVEWQWEAAVAVTNAVMQAKTGGGLKQRGGAGHKGGTWLLFAGPDRIGKKKMAAALSELIFGAAPFTLNFGSALKDDDDDGEYSKSSRGRRPLDRVVEAIRKNPFILVVLEDNDRAEAMDCSTIRRAMEVGRLPDSYGREVSLGSAIFVLIADWVPEDLRNSTEFLLCSEQRILNAANSGRRLELLVGETTPAKRRPDWLHSEDRPVKPRKKDAGPSLDLNLAFPSNDGEGSGNSSDITVELVVQDHQRLSIERWPDSYSVYAAELMDSIKDTILFKPVDFAPLRRKVAESITEKFSSIMGIGGAISVDEDVLDQAAGCLWVAGGSSAAAKLEDWMETVLEPCFEQLKRSQNGAPGGAPIRLAVVAADGVPGTPRKGSCRSWLSSKVSGAGGLSL